MVEQFVEFKSDVTLKGTLTLPSENHTYPVVVMVHGTGKVDRDENTKSVKINAFKNLAVFFAENGFATLRYDKRGVGESGGSYLETGVWDLVQDATAAVEFVKNHPNIKENRVILLGHSEGCWLVPAVYQNVPVDGIILLAGGVGSPIDSSKYQMQVLKEEVEHLEGIKGILLRWMNVGEKGVKAQEKFFNRLLNSEDAVVRVGLNKVNAKWFREHFQHDITKEFAQVNCPVLAITGSKDVQVKPDDVRQLAEMAGGPSEYHIIEDMNHLLRKQVEPRSILQLKTIYKKETSMNQPLEPELFATIKHWLENTFLAPIR